MKIKIALCQINVVDNKEKNIENATSMILKAVIQNADFIVLPEMFNCPYYNEKFIEFIVKDYGSGISDTNKARLFDIGKLFTTEGTKGEKGSGLGLALAKQIIEKLWLWIRNKVGKA